MRIPVPITLFLAIAIAVATAPALAQGAAGNAAEGACARAIAVVAGSERMPRHILNAISLVESGRWDGSRRANLAWPWTVYALGKGRHFDSKQAAINEVRRLRRQGVISIDVGCMQVNLRYHADAFTGLEEAFDPMNNVAYAAAFLKRLRRAEGAWSRAVAKYHSSIRAKGRRYWQRVRLAWHAERRRVWRERREARIRAGLARRAGRRGRCRERLDIAGGYPSCAHHETKSALQRR